MITSVVTACGSGDQGDGQTINLAPTIRYLEPAATVIVVPTRAIGVESKTVDRSATIAATPILSPVTTIEISDVALDSNSEQSLLPETNLTEGRVLRAIPTSNLDSRQRPADPISVFGVGERVYVSVEFVGIRSGESVGVRWKKGDEVLFTYEQPVGLTFTRGYFGFYFDPPTSNSIGSYSAEVLIEGVVAQTVGFWVSETIQGVPSG
tara:strand:+ start:1350 stop:1973 length:624 start_codon:yes stop_codon:yes gene_type:complete